MIAKGASAIGALSLVVALFGVVVLLDSRRQKAVAEEFLAAGVQAVAYDVQLDVDTGRGGDYIDEVSVSFVAGEVYRATLTYGLGDAEGNAVGLHAPDPGTRYAPPLAILHKRGDPDQVMARADAEELAAYSTTPAVAVAMISIGGTATLAAAVGAVLSARLRRRLAA